MICYLSRTGNVRNIVSRLDIPSIDISKIKEVTEHFFIFTYTDLLGEVPTKVMEFMDSNSHLCKGVIASGNINFQDNFCKAAEVLSLKYNVPIIRKIDLRGNQKDIETIKIAYKQMKGEESN